MAIVSERTLLPSPQQVVSFPYAYLEGMATYTIQNPAYYSGGGQINLTAYLTIFSPEAWHILAFTLLVLVALHFAMLSVYNQKGSVFAKVLSSASYSYSTLLHLDVSTRGKLPYKIFFLSSAAFAIVAMVHYEGQLISFMTTAAPQPSLKSFADAIDFGFKVIVHKETKESRDLETAPKGTGLNLVYEKLMRDRLDETFLEFSYEESVAWLEADPRLAIYTNSLLLHGDPRFVAMTDLEDAEKDHISLPLQHDSELLGVFNHNLIRMYQTGLLEYLSRKWMDERKPGDECGCPAAVIVGAASVLGYSNLFFPTLVLLVGGVLAAVLLIIEWSHKLLKVAKG